MPDHKLSTYAAKRNFDVTPEPAGVSDAVTASSLRFVVQKHAARRLHYDLRLELDGVFKSWAVTRGPSLDPADKRLAVEVEDHPLDYGDFEGTIPEGEYGGGTVMIWDRGTWEPEQPSPEDALRHGDLKFFLKGHKLKGSWVLVRMKHDRTGGKRVNWLLIKHKDQQAREGSGEALLDDNASIASARSMDDIAAGRGRKPAPFMTKPVAAATAPAPRAKATPAQKPKGTPAATPKPASGSRNAAAPRPDFVPPQLCRSIETPPTGSGWVHEVKFDGYRVQLSVSGGKAVLKTRKGLDWTERFGAIGRAAADLPDAVIDGEVVALDAAGAPDFAALQAALSDGKTDDLVFFAFDLLFEAGQDLRALPLSDRKTRLEILLGARRETMPTIRYVAHFTAAGEAVLLAACRMSLEGIVSKRLDAPYRSGRSDSWTKAKCRGGHDVVIGGWAETAGRFRSLLVGAHRGDRLVYLGRVGTGYSEAVVKRIMPALKQREEPTSPFGGDLAPRREPGVHWLRPELVAEIQFAGWTGDGMVRQASFKGLREDKPADEVEAETPASSDTALAKLTDGVKPKDKTKPAPAGAKPTPAPRHRPDKASAVVWGVVISHPEKSLWPAATGEPAVSKLDLARYFEAVGSAIMPHIAGRPCSLVRTPDGIDGEHFFQRHAMRGTSSLLSLMTVDGDHKAYLALDRVEGLAALAQVGATELHPANGWPGEPEIPGRLVFDLDPAPDVPFSAVIEAAREMRDRLEHLGLVPFPKTTGGKGLHVVTPLARDASLTWAEAKAFARQVSTEMAADSPDRYLVTMSKAARTGRIFLDYLRNDHLSTAVAPFSPRARPGAPVSMPLTWLQVRTGLDPQRFTLRTVPALVAKSEAWGGYAEAVRPMPRLDSARAKPKRR